MSYKISQKSKEDLEDIWLYTYKNRSLEQADRYLNLIFDEIEYISRNFESGKAIDHVRNGYRFSRIKSHFIFYRKVEEEKIEIVRILHQCMDIENRLE